MFDEISANLAMQKESVSLKLFTLLSSIRWEWSAPQSVTHSVPGVRGGMDSHGQRGFSGPGLCVRHNNNLSEGYMSKYDGNLENI